MKIRIIRFLMRVLSALPLGFHHANAHVVGWIAHHIARYRLKVVKDNIDKAFPDDSPKQRAKYVSDFYLHFGQLVCETIWFSHTSAERMAKSKIVTVLNPEESGRLLGVAPGVMILSGHFGNWELLPGFEQFEYLGGGKESCGFTRENSGMTYKKLSDPMWDQLFRESRLSVIGQDYENYLESSVVLRHILTHRDCHMVYFMDTDQRPYANAQAVMNVEFMGRPAQTMYAGAGVAHKLGFAVCYFSMQRKPGRKGYICELKTICDDASKMEVQDIMNEFYKLLEADVRKDPGNYLWSHRRWKHINKRTV